MKFISTLSFYTSIILAGNLVDRELSFRQEVCNDQISYCNNSCYQSTLANECQVDTMHFKCSCSDTKLNPENMPTLNIHFMPVQFYQCQEEDNTCVSKCIQPGATQNQINTCSNNCHSKFQCGTAKAGESQVLGSVGASANPGNTGGNSGGNLNSGASGSAINQILGLAALALTSFLF